MAKFKVEMIVDIDGKHTCREITDYIKDILSDGEIYVGNNIQASPYRSDVEQRFDAHIGDTFDLVLKQQKLPEIENITVLIYANNTDFVKEKYSYSPLLEDFLVESNLSSYIFAGIFQEDEDTYIELIKRGL